LHPQATLGPGCDFRIGATAKAAASPITGPNPAGSIPCLNTSVKTSCAEAPNAVRMPISPMRPLIYGVSHDCSEQLRTKIEKALKILTQYKASYLILRSSVPV